MIIAWSPISPMFQIKIMICLTERTFSTPHFRYWEKKHQTKQNTFLKIYAGLALPIFTNRIMYANMWPIWRCHIIVISRFSIHKRTKKKKNKKCERGRACMCVPVRSVVRLQTTVACCAISSECVCFMGGKHLTYIYLCVSFHKVFIDI